jgi:hypothetical protein
MPDQERMVPPSRTILGNSFESDSRLTSRRSALTKHGSDRDPLLEQRLAGVEEALRVGAGERAADRQRSAQPVNVLEPHDCHISERVFPSSSRTRQGDYRASASGHR